MWGFFYCYELNANLFGLTDLQGGSNTLPFIHLTNNNKPHCVAFFSLANSESDATKRSVFLEENFFTVTRLLCIAQNGTAGTMKKKEANPTSRN